MKVNRLIGVRMWDRGAVVLWDIILIVNWSGTVVLWVVLWEWYCGIHNKMILIYES